MRTETALAAVAAVLLVTTVVVPVAIPGVLADADAGPVRAGDVSIREVTVRTVDVGGERATLGVDTYLRTRGGPVGDASVRLRATDLDGGLVTATRTVPVGDLSGDHEVQVNGTLSLAREGGYRIEALLYVDGDRVDVAGKEVEGFDGLQPDYERTPVHFREFPGEVPTIEYRIAGVADNRSTLDVTAYLLNQGAAPASGYRLTLTARQVESNIVADETSVDVGSLGPGETHPAEGELTVPAGYNYYLDAILWRDGVVVGTARSAANLHPTETISVDERREPTGLEVRDFAPDDGNSGDRGGPGTTVASGDGGGGSTPGLGPVVALLALGAAVAGLHWRREDR